MELPLKAMLKDAGLEEDVITHIEKIGVKKMGNLATWVSEASDVQRIVRGFNFQEDEDRKDGAIAALRLCWLTAKANLDHGLKRKAAGLA